LFRIVVEQKLHRFNGILLLGRIDMPLHEIEKIETVYPVNGQCDKEQKRDGLQGSNPSGKIKADRQENGGAQNIHGLGARDASVGEAPQNEAAERQNHAVYIEGNLTEGQGEGNAQGEGEGNDDAFQENHVPRGIITIHVGTLLVLTEKISG